MIGESERLVRSVRHALARFRNHPGTLAVIAVSLGLGITANTLLFSVFRAALHPKHFVGIEHLVMIHELNASGHKSTVSAPNFRDLKRQQRSLAGMAGYQEQVFGISPWTGGPELVDGALVSPDLFEVLGNLPIAGRVFARGEYLKGGPRAVIVGNGFWHSHLAARDDVIGHLVTIDGVSHTIVGVMPRGFRFPWSAELWVPWTGLEEETRRGFRFIHAVGRVSPGVSVGAAAEDLGRIVSRATGREVDRPVLLTRLDDAIAGPSMRRAMLLVLLASGFLLIVICLNVAGIYSADSLSRQRETATCIALGASRAEVIRRCLTESVVAAMFGCALGLVGAHWAIQYVTTKFAGELPFWMEIRLDEAALLYTLGLSVVVGILSGLQPALQSSRTPSQALQVGHADGRKVSGVLKALVVGQIVAGFVLLVCTETALDGLRTLERHDLGLSLDQRLAVSIPLRSDRYETSASRSQAVTRLLRSARSLAGVEQASAIDRTPLKDPPRSVDRSLPDGGSASPGTGTVRIIDYLCDPEYFSTMGIPLLAGETFQSPGGSNSRNEVIVSESLARLYWGDEPLAAVGRSFPIGNRQYRVLAVVGDSSHRPTPGVAPYACYRQLASGPPRQFSMVFHSTLTAGTLHRQLRAAIDEFDRSLAISPVKPMRLVHAESLSKTTATTYTLAILTGFALALTLLGIYGLTSFTVAQRARELAVRRALGCTNARIVWLVLGQVARLTAIGTIVGLALSRPMIGLLRGGVHGVGDLSIASYLAICLAIVATTVLAALIPATASIRSNAFRVLNG